MLDSTSWRAPRGLRFWVIAAAVLAAVVHLGALSNGFTYDDHVLIEGDPGLRQLSGLGQRLLEPSWPEASGEEVGAWRPVTTGTWALVWIATNGAEVGFHAMGVALHAAVTALSVLLLAELAPIVVAGVAGLLFAVHPVHVEAVANVAGSAEPLSALFLFVALLVHARGGPSYGLGRVGGVTLCYALAVLAKEGAAVAPLMIFLLDGARRDVRLRDLMSYVGDRLTLYLALFAALAFILVLRLDVVGAVAGATHPPGAAILTEAPRSWTVFSTWPEYVRLLLFPLELSPDYGPRVLSLSFGWTPAAVVGAAAGLAAFAGAWLAWRRGAPLARGKAGPRIVGFAILWIAAALLPVANVLYLGPVLVAERTLYVASFGAVAALAWVLVASEHRLGAWAALLIGLVVALGAVRTTLRVPVWANDDRLMGSLVEDHPESGTGWLYVGGRLAMEGRAPEARMALRYAIGLLNSGYATTTQVASHLMAVGDRRTARVLLERAWREEPRHYTAPGLLAAVELEEGRTERAAAAARAAVVIRPDNPSMHQLLAQAYVGLGDWDAAIRARRQALTYGFSDRARIWMLLAADYRAADRPELARAALDSAALRPMTDEERVAWRQIREAVDSLGPSRP